MIDSTLDTTSEKTEYVNVTIARGEWGGDSGERGL